MSSIPDLNTTAALTAGEATSVDFWSELCPALSIGKRGAPPRARIPDLSALDQTLRQEGYINTSAVLPSRELAILCDGIQQLAARNIPPPFAFVYDEYWRIFQSLAPFLSSSLGADYRMLPDIWAWYVRPSNEAAGWKPHRDRYSPTIGADNTPRSLTVWLPLTDTNPLNGCMYVLPAHHDPELHTPVMPANGDYQFSGDSLQNIRALPATAGSLLAWNQSLLHWGSRASPLGTHPRCSIAAQFQRGDHPALETPLLDPLTPPSFEQRIGLIGHLICVFSGFLTLPPEIRILGTALKWKHWPSPAKS